MICPSEHSVNHREWRQRSLQFRGKHRKYFLYKLFTINTMIVARRLTELPYILLQVGVRIRWWTLVPVLVITMLSHVRLWKGFQTCSSIKSDQFLHFQKVLDLYIQQCYHYYYLSMYVSISYKDYSLFCFLLY